MGFFGKLPKTSFLTKKAEKIKKKIDDAVKADDDLVRIGESNFFTSPDEAKEPNYGDPFAKVPLGFETEIVWDDCNFGGQVNGVIAYLRLPAFQFVYRNPKCSKPVEPELSPPLAPSEQHAIMQCSDGRTARSIISREEVRGLFVDKIFVQVVSPRYTPTQNVQDLVRTSHLFFFNDYITSARKYPNEYRGLTSELVSTAWVDQPIEDICVGFFSASGNYIGKSPNGIIQRKSYYYVVRGEVNDGTGWKPLVSNIPEAWYVTRFKTLACPQKIDPPLPPELKNMDCCSNLEALLKLTLKRIGSLPASVPDNFTKQNPTYINVQSLAELMFWQTQQLDALMGAYPIEIKIEDNDLTKEGNQEQKITVPNQAEAMAEILGLMLTIKRDTHTTLITAIKAMAEAGMSKNVAIKTLDVALANAEFLGYKLEQKEKEIPSLFTPGGKDITETLKEKNIKIITYENTDKKDIQDDLKTLLTMASRWNAQNWRAVGKSNPVEALKDHLFGKNEAIKKAAEPNKQDDFDTFTEQCERGFTEVSGITDATNPWGKPYTERPKIREIGEGGRYNADGTAKEQK